MRTSFCRARRRHLAGRAVPRTQTKPYAGKLDEDRWTTVRISWLDELEAHGASNVDDRLRNLVDALPDRERHMVERVIFGQSTTREAAEELDVQSSVGERLLRSGLKQLREWIESDWKPPAARRRREKPAAPPRCVVVNKYWGRCRQSASADGWCPQHIEWWEKSITPDAEYERKVVRGLVTPAVNFMSPTELNATMRGKYKGDGRRLDQYVTTEPVE